jgi:hypothetical protein
MRTLMMLTVGLCASCIALARADDDDRAKAIATQKKAAEAAYKAMEVGDAAHVETKHLLVYAPKAMEKRLEAVGKQLEKYHDTAAKTLSLDKEAYPGKITVYLFAEKENLATFIRRVEKRRPMGVESGSYSAEDARLHIVAVPGAGKGAIPVELRAGEMVASLLLQRKAGARTELPDWLTAGFGRATSYRATTGQKFVAADRKQLRLLVKKRNADDAWSGKLEGEEAELVQASVAEMVCYGLSTARLTKLLDGFKPGENIATKTIAQALEAANLTAEQLNRAWKKYVK